MKNRIPLLLTVFACLLVLTGCVDKTVKLALPFTADDISSIEMYRFAGAPASAEKKTVTAKGDIKTLYDELDGLPLKSGKLEETTGAVVTSFRFNLSDGTSYELIYGCFGVKKGNLKSTTGGFEYATSADVGALWTLLSNLEALPAAESDLPH